MPNTSSFSQKTKEACHSISHTISTHGSVWCQPVDIDIFCTLSCNNIYSMILYANAHIYFQSNEDKKEQYRANRQTIEEQMHGFYIYNKPNAMTVVYSKNS